MKIQKNIFKSIIAIITCLIIPVQIVSYTYKKHVHIDWQKGYIVTQSYYSIKTDSQGMPIDFTSKKAIPLNQARLIAYKEAREEALEYIATSILTIRIDANNYLKDIVTSHPYAQKRLADLLQKKIKTTEYPADFYAVRCKARLKISDLMLLLPFDFPEHAFPRPATHAIKTAYTSLVIDTRGLKVKPMIFPVIHDEDGLEIYNRYYIDVSYAHKDGMVSYSYNQEEVAQHPKSGSHPYYTVALKSLKGSPVISHNDVRRIFSSSKTVENLKKCNVIFIIDKKQE